MRLGTEQQCRSHLTAITAHCPSATALHSWKKCAILKYQLPVLNYTTGTFWTSIEISYSHITYLVLLWKKPLLFHILVNLRHRKQKTVSYFFTFVTVLSRSTTQTYSRGIIMAFTFYCGDSGAEDAGKVIKLFLTDMYYQNLIEGQRFSHYSPLQWLTQAETYLLPSKFICGS